MQSAESTSCRVCHSPAPNRCSQCQNTYYCTQEHQQSDWPTHKKQCFPKDGTVFPVSGILFPADEDAPRLVTVNCIVAREIEDDDDTIVYKVEFAQFLGDTDYDRKLVFNTNGPGGIALKHPIALYIRDNYLNDGSKPNRSIARVSAGRLPHEWRGNVLGLKMTSYFAGKYINATMDDMPPIIAFLQQYGS